MGTLKRGALRRLLTHIRLRFVFRYESLTYYYPLVQWLPLKMDLCPQNYISLIWCEHKIIDRRTLVLMLLYLKKQNTSFLPYQASTKFRLMIVHHQWHVGFNKTRTFIWSRVCSLLQLWPSYLFHFGQTEAPYLEGVLSNWGIDIPNTFRTTKAFIESVAPMYFSIFAQMVFKCYYMDKKVR